jgi:hypothetical protein
LVKRERFPLWRFSQALATRENGRFVLVRMKPLHAASGVEGRGEVKSGDFVVSALVKR